MVIYWENWLSALPQQSTLSCRIWLHYVYNHTWYGGHYGMICHNARLVPCVTVFQTWYTPGCRKKNMVHPHSCTVRAKHEQPFVAQSRQQACKCRLHIICYCNNYLACRLQKFWQPKPLIYSLQTRDGEEYVINKVGWRCICRNNERHVGTFISLSTKEAALSNSLPLDLQHDIVILTCLLVPPQQIASRL